MAISRRSLLTAATAFMASGLGGPIHARASSEPVALTCTMTADRRFQVAGLSTEGKVIFQTELPDRGHGIAVSSDRTIAAVFARRPGRFVLLIDPLSGEILDQVQTPQKRHVFGHGFFSSDGKTLFSSEHDFEFGRGVLGLYDVSQGFKRFSELETHGVGPHEAILTRDSYTIAVVNGGILTHPDFPRRKLNLANMDPSIVFLSSQTGELLDKAGLPEHFRQLSTRHMAEDAEGTIWFGCQYEGYESDVVPLIGTVRPGEQVSWLNLDAKVLNQLRHYVGSVAASRDGSHIAASSPRGGTVISIDASSRRMVEIFRQSDVCGLASHGSGFLATDGREALRTSQASIAEQPGWVFDNHAVTLEPVTYS